MMVRLLGAISALGLILVSWSAQALDAESLRRAIIDDLNTRTSLFPNIQVTYDVVVREAADGFAVTIEDVRVADQPRSFQLDFGTWSFNVKDLGDDLYRFSDVASPGLVTLAEGSGPPVKVASYNLERLDGRWSSVMMNLLDGDLILSNFKAGLESAGALFSMERLTSKAVGQIHATGLVDQQATGQGFGLRGAVQGRGRIEVAEVSFEYNIEGVDSAANALYMKLAQDMSLLQDETLDLESKRRMAAEAFEDLPSSKILPSSFGERFTLSNVSVFDHSNQKQGGVDAVEFSFGASGLKTNSADSKFGIKVTNVTFDPPPAMAGAAWLQVVPRNLSFVMAVEQVPVETLWQAFFRTIAQSILAKDDATRDLAMTAVGAELMSALTMAGTRLRLPHLSIETPSAGLNADGILEADAQAMTGAKGALNLAITGLDNVMALASSAATPAEQQAMGMLFMLKATARRETGADGQPVDVWALELTPDGGILLNGAPFGMPPMPQ